MTALEKLIKAKELASEAAELLKTLGLEDDSPLEQLAFDDEQLNEAWDKLDSAAGMLAELAEGESDDNKNR